MIYDETLNIIRLDAILLNDYIKVCNSCNFHNKHMR